MYVCKCTYVCVFSIQTGKDVLVILIYIFQNKYVIIIDAPRVSIYPPQSQHTVGVGERLLLYCTAEGLPIPTIQWYKNNVVIPGQSSRSYLAPTHHVGSTVYTCEGKNNAGNMEKIGRANITVIVEGNKIIT